MTDPQPWPVDDRTVGLVLRALRRRNGLRQDDLAATTRTSQSSMSRAERGHVEDLTLRQLRRLFGGVDARLQVTPQWRGGDLERLLDDEHALIAGATAETLAAAGWRPELEVTYSIYAERGSIDVLATKREALAAIVVEVKSDIASAEQLGRKLDEKARLAPQIVFERYGWRPKVVGRVVVMPESSRLRRRFQPGSVLARMFPATGRQVRAWLHAPSGPISARWFLSFTRPLTVGRPRGGRHRVVPLSPRSAEAAGPIRIGSDSQEKGD